MTAARCAKLYLNEEAVLNQTAGNTRTEQDCILEVYPRGPMADSPCQQNLLVNGMESYSKYFFHILNTQWNLRVYPRGGPPGPTLCSPARRGPRAKGDNLHYRGRCWGATVHCHNPRHTRDNDQQPPTQTQVTHLELDTRRTVTPTDNSLHHRPRVCGGSEADFRRHLEDCLQGLYVQECVLNQFPVNVNRVTAEAPKLCARFHLNQSSVSGWATRRPPRFRDQARQEPMIIVSIYGKKLHILLNYLTADTMAGNSPIG